MVSSSFLFNRNKIIHYLHYNNKHILETHNPQIQIPKSLKDLSDYMTEKNYNLIFLKLCLQYH